MSATIERMPLKRARLTGEYIVGMLGKYCDRIEIAGSIRRQRPTCGDVDIVALPRAGELANMIARCVASPQTELVKSGPQEHVYRLANGVQLDLWIARPEVREMFEVKPTNFGSLLLCRTGSVSHNIFLVERAKDMGLRWNPHHGVFDAEGKLLACETEEAIFKALKLDFVAPERRER